MCSHQCPTPNLTSNYLVVNQPREGFAAGTKLQIACKTGYKPKVQFISCGDNKQWTSPGSCQALECLLPGDNGTHYRGTQNTSSDGTPCLPWNIAHPRGEQYKIPVDGTNHNYCRHDPGFSMSGTWCYTTYEGSERIPIPCSIPTCGKYCPPPDLQHTHFAIEIPNTGLRTGTDLDLDCKAGYLKNESAAITCELDGQWSDFPSGICEEIMKITDITECPEDRYGVACSRQCNCNKQYTVNCDRQNGTCHFIQGRRGIDCSLNVNECETDVGICGDNSNCTNTTGSYTCICHPGYTRTSGYCEECPMDRYGVACSGKCNCIEQYTVNCDRQNGTCHCIQGRRGVDCSDDVNECETDVGICGNNSNCTNTEGSYTCICHPAYTRSSGYCHAICKPPALQCNSRLLMNRSIYIQHDTIEIECDDGFEFEGETRFICQNDRSWNGTMPKFKLKTTRFDMTETTYAVLIGSTSGLALCLIVVTVALIVTCSRKRDRNRPVCSTANEVEMANIHQYESISHYEVINHEEREPQSIYSRLTPS